jgi:simple sugar transport system substrate-binding protein
MFKKAVLIVAGLALLAVPGLSQRLVIYFFPGGPPGCPFATIVYNGAKHAAEILGDRVDVRFLWSDWLPEKMVLQFQEAVAVRPHAICIMGHPGDEALAPFVADAIARGIIVTSMNTTLPTLEAKYRAEGFGYVGQDLYGSGYMVGEAVVQRAGLKPGDRALVWGLIYRAPVRGLRSRGVVDALEKAGVIVDYIEISPEVDADPALGIPTFVAHMRANPGTKAVVTDHGALTATLPIYLAQAGFRPGQVYGAGFDATTPALQGIRDGWIGVVHSQQPFLQGFLPIFQVYLAYHFKSAGLHIDTGIGLIDKANVEVLADLIARGLAG